MCSKISRPRSCRYGPSLQRKTTYGETKTAVDFVIRSKWEHSLYLLARPVLSVIFGYISKIQELKELES